MHEIEVNRASNMIDPSLTIWGWEIPVYLFLGGVTAGIMILAPLVRRRSGAEPSRCVRLERCGDGVVDVGEECDDGTVTDEDGCSAACRDESADMGAEGCACVTGAQDVPWAPVAGVALVSLPLMRRRRRSR